MSAILTPTERRALTLIALGLIGWRVYKPPNGSYVGANGLSQAISRLVYLGLAEHELPDIRGVVVPVTLTNGGSTVYVIP